VSKIFLQNEQEFVKTSPEMDLTILNAIQWIGVFQSEKSKLNEIHQPVITVEKFMQNLFEQLSKVDGNTKENMNWANSMLDSPEARQVLRLPMEELKNLPAQEILCYFNLDFLLPFAINMLQATSPDPKWQNHKAMDECFEIAKTKDTVYQYIAQMMQVQLETMQIEEKHIKLLLNRLHFFDKEDFSYHSMVKALSKLGLYLYTAPSDPPHHGPYSGVNKAMREDNETLYKELWHPIGLILRGFRHLHDDFGEEFKPKLQFKNGKPVGRKKRTVWRGVRSMTDEQYREFTDLLTNKKSFYFPAFTSTSRLKKKARNFMKEDADKEYLKPTKESVLFEIELDPNAIAIDLDKFSHYGLESGDREFEILLYPTQKFEVVEVMTEKSKTIGGRGVIRLKTVSRPHVRKVQRGPIRAPMKKRKREN